MKHTHLRITHCATSALANHESAKPGEATETLNLRQREEALEAVGAPLKTSDIQPGTTLLCINQDRFITINGNQVCCNGNVIATVTGTVLDACISGSILVIGTTQGLIYLHHTANGYVNLNPTESAPLLHFAATDASQLTKQIEPFEFHTPYSRWQAPLADDDITALARLSANAHESMAQNAASNGRFTGPVLCRYAVRAFDDKYLWVSAPVLVGSETLAANYRVTAEVESDTSGFTGTMACQASRTAYSLGITVLGGIPQPWHGLVKAIDIFVTDEASVTDNSTLDYRCSISTVGTRRYLLEFGPAAQSRSAIAHALLHAKWRLIASTSHLAELATGHFVTSTPAASTTAIFPGLTTWTVSRLTLGENTLTNEFFKSIHANIRHQALPHSMISHNGQLHVGGCALQAMNRWHPATWFNGAITQQPCHIATAITLNTPDGASTLVRHDDMPFTPQSLNALLATAHTHTTRLRIEVTSGGTTRVWESDVVPVPDMDLAAALNPNLLGHTLSTGSATIPASPAACTAVHPGTLLSHAIDNPFVLEYRHNVSGSNIKALAAASKPIYSGGLGRYPLYIFTQNGIFALPQNASGSYGEARLIHNTALADDVKPVQGDQCVWFVSDKRLLYDLCGTRLTRHMNHCTATQLAWNTVEQELWMRYPDGALQLLMAHDRTTRLSMHAAQLWSRDTTALAIDAQGQVFDITQETPRDNCPIIYRSHPIALDHLMRTTVTAIVWNIFSDQAQLSLSMHGERGTSCHGFLVNSIRVQGNINAPLCIPVVAPPLRTMRLTIQGTVKSGTLLLPTHVHISKK